jgi:hypothetical protein
MDGWINGKNDVLVEDVAFLGWKDCEHTSKNTHKQNTYTKIIENSLSGVAW